MWSVVSGFCFLLQTLWSYLSTNKTCTCAIFFTVQPSIRTGDSNGQLCCFFHDGFVVLGGSMSDLGCRICCSGATLQLLECVDQDFRKATGNMGLVCFLLPWPVSGIRFWSLNLLHALWFSPVALVILILTCDSGAGTWPLFSGSWALLEVWWKSCYPTGFSSYLASNIKAEADLHCVSLTSNVYLIYKETDKQLRGWTGTWDTENRNWSS